jgi:hypothetical protein
LAPEQIAERTGWTAEQVRRAMHEETAPSPPTWIHRGGMDFSILKSSMT